MRDNVDFSIGVHRFMMTQNTAASSNSLSLIVTIQAGMMVKGVNPSLADAAQLMAPDPSKLLQTFSDLWRYIIWIRIIYEVDLGHDHSNASSL